jgi:hypothetical protein
MSDAALSERPAALERSAPSNAMKAAAGADVRSSHPATGMETPDARKTWGGRRADMDSCGRAKPMEAAAPSKTWRSGRTDVGNSDASAMEMSCPA